MGCSCTKGETNGSNKNGLGRPSSDILQKHGSKYVVGADVGGAGSGGGDEPTTGTILGSSFKQHSTNSLLRPFANILKQNKSSADLNASKDSNPTTTTTGTNNTSTNDKNAKQNSSSSLLPPHSTGGASINANNQSQNQLTPTAHRQPIIQSKQLVPNGIYSFLNLPLKTQHLLNAQHDFDSNEFELNDKYDFLSSSSSTNNSNRRSNIDLAELKSLKTNLNKQKSNREILIYLSTPFNLKCKNDYLADTSSLFNSRYNNYSNNPNSTTQLTSESVFVHLRSYCAQQINNCDLSLIDLNDPTGINSDKYEQCYFKYYRRLLGKLIINDLLNVSNSKNPFNYSPNCFLFVIFLSDVQFDEDEKNLLCPDRIESNDYRHYLENKLNRDELDLFNRWYKRTESSTVSGGSNANNNNNNNNSKNSYFKLNDRLIAESGGKLNELDQLLIILKTKFEQTASELNEEDEEDEENDNSNDDNNNANSLGGGGSGGGGGGSNESRTSLNLKLKYLKSIQQEEIELVVKHIDPSSIIWFNLTQDNKSSSSSLFSQTSYFNQLRYKTVLDLLQSQVLAHNYKDCVLVEHDTRKSISSGKISLSQTTPTGQQPQSQSHHHHHHHHHHSHSHSHQHHSHGQAHLNQYEKTMNEFLFNSIKSLIDNFISDLNKKQTNNVALKIDKQLAQEVYKHYELYKHLKFQHSYLTSKYPRRKQIQNKFDSILNDYLNERPSSGSSKYPLILYNLNELRSSNSNRSTELNEICSTDELISKWIQQQQQQQQSNQNENVETNKTSIVYRFCSHTILSSDLTTLIQSILHQICYLLDIHESWSFNSPSNLIDNFIKALAESIKSNNNDSSGTSTKTTTTTTSNTNNATTPNDGINSAKQQQLIILIDRIDRLIQSEYDQLILLDALNKIFNHTQPLLNLKLVLTYSITVDSYTDLIEPIENIFKTFSDKSIKQLNLNSLLSASGGGGTGGGAAAAVGGGGGGGNDYNQTSYNNQLDYLKQINKKLNDLFKTNNLIEANNLHLIDVLIQLLSKSRYGLKQCEIIDLLRLYISTSSHSSSSITSITSTLSFSSVSSPFTTSQQHPNQIHYDYLIQIVWYTFKYYSSLLNELNLIETLIDNNQTLFKLEREPFYLCLQKQNTNDLLDTKIFHLINNYYQTSVDKLTSLPSSSSRLLSSYINVRAYQELPIVNYYLNLIDSISNTNSGNKTKQNFNQIYLNSFALNTKWLLNKSLNCSTVLYFVHDLETYKRLFISYDDLINRTSMSTSIEDYLLNDDVIVNNLDELNLFEMLFYRVIYALNQDPNQIYMQLKAYLNLLLKHNNTTTTTTTTATRRRSSCGTGNTSGGNGRVYLNQLLNDLEKSFKSNLNLPQLVSLNYENLIEQEQLSLNDRKSQQPNENWKKREEKIAFNLLKSLHTFYSKVFFLSSNSILALSDTHNEIKLWSINSNLSFDSSSYSSSAASSEQQQQPLELIRSIKLNRSPRDLRLLNKHIAVILVDRNLHLFDLNKCKHVLDLNSTMSANVPFFEIHDHNHVVLLARNRLSVILMKVNCPKEDQFDDEQTENNNNNNKTISSTKTIDDDMFLFKVGEDRYLNSLLVSKNGQVMVCGDEVQKPFPLLVWNLNKRNLVYDLRQPKHEFITTIQSIGSSGRYVVCACQEEGELRNCLIVYDLSTGQLFKKLKAKVNFVSVEISEESNVIIACLENAQIIIYDLSNGSKKFTLNSNRYPINKIKILDTNKNFKNYFLTFDTKGYDWTIRLWDLNRGDTLISSFTCPSRIVSCCVNIAPLYFEHTSKSDDDLLIGVALYGIKQLLVLKLTTISLSKRLLANNEKSLDLFSNDESLKGLHKDISL